MTCSRGWPRSVLIPVHNGSSRSTWQSRATRILGQTRTLICRGADARCGLACRLCRAGVPRRIRPALRARRAPARARERGHSRRGAPLCRKRCPTALARRRHERRSVAHREDDRTRRHGRGLPGPPRRWRFRTTSSAQTAASGIGWRNAAVPCRAADSGAPRTSGHRAHSRRRRGGGRASLYRRRVRRRAFALRILH